MDLKIRDGMLAEGFELMDPTMVPVAWDPSRGVLPAPRDFLVVQGENKFALTRAPLTPLLEGPNVPPDLKDYPEEYTLFFYSIEATVLEVCTLAGRDETDDEMLDLYSQIRRRPDTPGKTTLHTYVLAALQVYLSGHPTSRMEFEAVLQRLERSVRTFRTHPTSRNYLAYLRSTFKH